MADASAEVEVVPFGGDLIVAPNGVEAATKIWKGQLVQPDATDGYYEHAGDDAGIPRCFLAVETVDNTSGSDGDLVVEVAVAGAIVWTGNVGTLTRAHIGELACAVDSSTLSEAGTTTNDVALGRIVGWDDDADAPIILIG